MAAIAGSLGFAYRYPFSSEARGIVAAAGARVEYKYLDMAKRHIESALNEGLEPSETGVSSLKSDYIMSYLYSRMLISATGRPDLISGYAFAEAKRSAGFLLKSDQEEMLHAAEELGLHLTKGLGANAECLTISFQEFLRYTTQVKGMGLSNQRLNHGVVLLFKNNMAKLMREAIKQQIKAGLPIARKELPAEVVEYSKKMRLNVKERVKRVATTASHGWIEKLLATPIADVRHRTVNLILAPYLVNVRGMEVEEATKLIMDYIEACKLIDPTTRVNESYIRYQCTYSKRKGSKPLSLIKAKELLGAALNTDTLQ
ncbi:MAG TPA: DNA primase noncatalytic subunit PriX [Candidatus Baltobacteraceae bacterium]|nr:DNA primase noncatalytic subunit PriX [Candidatus Baltobacteraceae bacterium]